MFLAIITKKNNKKCGSDEIFHICGVNKLHFLVCLFESTGSCYCN